MVYEAMNTGAGVAASVLGIPAVAFAISIMHMGYAGIHPATVGFQQRAWTDRGLNPPLGVSLARSLLNYAAELAGDGRGVPGWQSVWLWSQRSRRD